jgi:hypothetical protein
MLRAVPVGEDTVTDARTRGRSAAEEGSDLYERAEAQLTDGAAKEEDDTEGFDEDFNEKPSDAEFLQMVREAEDQATTYMNQVNRKHWTRSYRAFNNEHFIGSKYGTDDWTNRSKLFVPATKKAVRKDMAAVAASLFGSLDAVTVLPGNEGDPVQRASAAVIQEIVNYRTDRNSNKASIPWFHVAMGSRLTSLVTGFCVSKQSWKLELRRSKTEKVTDEDSGEEQERDVWEPDIDRPDCELFPPENYIIDPAANWTCPVQDAAYVFLKYPMRIDEIRRKQRDPRMPWKALSESVLRGGGDKSKFDMEAIRRAREQGIDRLSDVEQSSRQFDIIWVYECFIRTAGEDWTFLSVGDKQLLTDPKPVREVYPEQFGERPLVMGYGALEPFRIFPTSNVSSWQPLQQEMNDIRNLTLDAIKQNISPVSKVVRGRQVDLDQLKRRGWGSSVMVTKPDDVTWDRPPDVPQSTVGMKQQLDIDFDDLAGQANYGSVQNNNALGKTLGGLQLAAGAANAVQEFDIRIWIETWCEPVLAQIVRLIQFYESDPTVLGLAGEKAKLMQKYGVSQIDNDLLENQVTLRVNVGLGAGDPQQRLAKFNSAVQVLQPLCQSSPDFQNGSKRINIEAAFEEVFGAAGYRDGGKRFLIEGQPNQNPMQQPQVDALVAKTEKDKALAKKAVLDALSNAAKVGIDIKGLELEVARTNFDQHLAHVDQVGKATDMGHQHGSALAAAKLAAQGLGPDGQPLQPPGGEGIPGEGGTGSPPGVPPGGEGPPQDADVQAAQAQGEGEPAGNALPAEAPKPRGRRLVHHRGPDGRISHTDVLDL